MQFLQANNGSFFPMLFLTRMQCDVIRIIYMEIELKLELEFIEGFLYGQMFRNIKFEESLKVKIKPNFMKKNQSLPV